MPLQWAEGEAPNPAGEAAPVIRGADTSAYSMAASPGAGMGALDPAVEALPLEARRELAAERAAAADAIRAGYGSRSPQLVADVSESRSPVPAPPPLPVETDRRMQVRAAYAQRLLPPAPPEPPAAPTSPPAPPATSQPGRIDSAMLAAAFRARAHAGRSS